ncbi:BTAD domain-containing putative transcriptional regulator [Allokutzneria oryzae]|uniref:BTAD domain-containing putative transcriptional regulator n=1 Tax=Allokutzneria oryzae TaxID=1378989 RepID=A0ABV6A778_9PSEU
MEVLGPPRAWLGEDELDLGPARQRAVFAVLVSHANRTVSASELIDGVWGTSAPASATGSLHTYVSGLRRALRADRDLLVSAGSGYCLRLAPGVCDAEVFDAARVRAQRLAAAGERHEAVAVLDTALGLWRGDAYSGVPGPCADLERQRLAELRLTAIELRARALLDLGRHAELVAELTVLVGEHPLHEALRELLMLALHRSGRQAEALEAFRDARTALVDAQGIEPGPVLQDLHRRILGGEAEPAATEPLLVVPTPVARAIRRGGEPERLLGRAEETALLRGLVSDVLTGRGATVWIEGEPGIGKSELLTVALADSGSRGCQLGWAVADELAGRFPLQVVMDCLGVEPLSADPDKARLAAELHTEPAHGGWGRSDPVRAAVDRLLALVDQTCAVAPLVLVVDDLQWADDASILLWRRLAAATRQLPLLLVAATRTDPGRHELGRLRQSVAAGDGHVLRLEPLSAADTADLIGRVVGAEPGPSLRALARRTAGNPLYTKEVASALVRGNSVRLVDGRAEVDQAATDAVPESLLAAVRRTLDFLSEDTRDVLRTAALLGMEFAVGDLAVVAGRSPLELLSVLDEAIQGSVVVEAGDQLAFRHPFLRQALYDSIATPLRAALHRHAAEALDGAGAPVKPVAEHLVAVPAPIDAWVTTWLVTHHTAVCNRAPLIAVELLTRVLDTGAPDRQQRATLLVALVKVLFRLERSPEDEARKALAIATDPADVAEMRHLIAVMHYRAGDTATAIGLVREALDAPEAPEIWRARHRSLLANFRRGDLADLDLAERTARQVHAESVAVGEPYPIAHALQTLWLVSSIRRDHASAVEHVDRALEAVGDDADLAELRCDLLDNRMFTLQNLDRLAEAEAALRSAREVATRHDLPTGLQVSAAVHYYWVGRWDEALAELESVTEDGPAITFYGMREPGPAALLLHGAAALIAARRDDRAGVAAHLDAAEAHLPTTGAERESCDFYLMALALDAEQRGDDAEALRRLEPILRPDYARMMLRHQWLPYVAGLALRSGATDVAHQALAVCEAEAAQEVVPARAFAAAAHCRALVSGDPEPVVEAAEHYRAVGRSLELALALEDAAALLAAKGRADEATAALAEAVGLFAGLSARWDVQRARNRLAEHGIRSTTPVSVEAVTSSGWDALSPIENQVARLAASGLSNPEISSRLALPRRTVQSHVSHVLDKLRSPSRSAIADHLG